MATTSSHNRKSSAVKRILSEAKELAADPSTEYAAQPLESNIFEWHFTLRGPQQSEFEHGLYHGRILLPPEYPFRPPNLMVLTPNGRWELNKKICLSFTGFHEESWQPAWGIRTALLGMQSLMAARAQAAVGIGALDYPEEERKRLALKSKDWTCPTCAATCAEMLGSAERPQMTEGGKAASRTGEELPEGLVVDAGAEARKAEALNAEQSSSSAQEAAVSDVLTPSNSASSMSTSTTTTDECPASPDLWGTSTPQVQEDMTPHQVITAAGPAMHHQPRNVGIGIDTSSSGGSAIGGARPPTGRLGSGNGVGGASGGSTFRSGANHLPHHHAAQHHDAYALGAGTTATAATRLSAEVIGRAPRGHQHQHQHHYQHQAATPASTNASTRSSASSGSRSGGGGGIATGDVASPLPVRDEAATQANATPVGPRTGLDERPDGTATTGAAVSAGGTTTPGAATATATAAAAEPALALVDRCIALLTVLIGVLLLRMVVL